jgi:tetratricopeptide (TPR) repeat protein
MPVHYQAEQGGRAILEQLTIDLGRLATQMRQTVTADHLPADHRARLMKEKVEAARLLRQDASEAFDAWAASERTEARKVIRGRSIASPAEESRRVAEELRITRLVDSARVNGTNARRSAEDLGERAERAYQEGDTEEAMILARAALELDPASQANAAQIIAVVQVERDMEDPAKKAAYAAIENADIGTRIFLRDADAAYSATFQQAADLARALGDSVSVNNFALEATQASIDSKMAAAVQAQIAGTTYVEPDGVIPGATQNRDPRGETQPIGARLSGTTA